MTDQSLSAASIAAIMAYLPPDTPTLSQTIDWIRDDPDLAPNKRRDLRSALVTMAKAVGRPPEQIPASHRWLRQHLAVFHPQHLGISPKRWSNIKSDVSFAFRHVGLVNVEKPHLAPFPPEWQVLWDRVEEDRMRWNLSRFFHFCSAVGISPEDVDDTVMERFRFSLIEESFIKNPDWTAKYATNLWNKAVDHIPGWPARRLTKTNDRKDYALPHATFPASFQADVDRFIDRVSGTDIMAEDGPVRPFAAVAGVGLCRSWSKRGSSGGISDMEAVQKPTATHEDSRQLCSPVLPILRVSRSQRQLTRWLVYRFLANGDHSTELGQYIAGRCSHGTFDCPKNLRSIWSDGKGSNSGSYLGTERQGQRSSP